MFKKISKNNYNIFINKITIKDNNYSNKQKINLIKF